MSGTKLHVKQNKAFLRMDETKHCWHLKSVPGKSAVVEEFLYNMKRGYHINYIDRSVSYSWRGACPSFHNLQVQLPLRFTNGGALPKRARVTSDLRPGMNCTTGCPMGISKSLPDTSWDESLTPNGLAQRQHSMFVSVRCSFRILARNVFWLLCCVVFFRPFSNMPEQYLD
jgi:hypothetical protein